MARKKPGRVRNGPAITVRAGARPSLAWPVDWLAWPPDAIRHLNERKAEPTRRLGRLTLGAGRAGTICIRRGRLADQPDVATYFATRASSGGRNDGILNKRVKNGPD